MKVNELTARLEQAINTLKRKVDATPNHMYVMASQGHVNVMKSHGLNGTDVNVRTAFSALHAVVYEDENTAFKNGFDGYLIDGAGNQIVLSPVLAVDYFEEEIKKAETSLNLLKNCHETM